MDTSYQITSIVASKYLIFAKFLVSAKYVGTIQKIPSITEHNTVRSLNYRRQQYSKYLQIKGKYKRYNKHTRIMFCRQIAAMMQKPKSSVRDSGNFPRLLILVSVMMMVYNINNTPSSRTVRAFSIPATTSTTSIAHKTASSFSVSLYSQKSPYEDYMDALQKQQQQYQSFRQLNTAKTYETEQLVMNNVPPTTPVVILPSNDSNEAAATTTDSSTSSSTAAAIPTSTSNEMKISNPLATEMSSFSNSIDTTAEQNDVASQQQQPPPPSPAGVWSNGWNGNNVLNSSGPPKSKYMYQKKNVNGIDSTTISTVAATTTTTTMTTPQPTFGSTVPPPPLQQQSPVNDRSTTTDKNNWSSTTQSSTSSTTIANPGVSGGEGRPVFPSYATAVPTTSGSVDTGGRGNSSPVPSGMISSTDPISDSSPLFETNGMNRDSTMTTDITSPVTPTNAWEETLQTPVSMSAEVQSSLWNDYNSQRQDTESNPMTNAQTKQEQQPQEVSMQSSLSSDTTPTKEVHSETIEYVEDSVNNNIVSAPSSTNTLNSNYDEKNDPEPLKFNFMGNAVTTDMTSETKTKDSTNYDDASLSNESFLKAITSVETVSSGTNVPAHPPEIASMEDFDAEPMQIETSIPNPFQQFWESNMSMLKKFGKTNEVDKGKPIVSVELPTTKPYIDTRGMTERIMKKIDDAKLQQQAAGGAGGSTTYAAFLKVEDNWSKLKQQSSKSVPIHTNRKSMTMAPFVTSDAALGNPKCWTKLREQAALASTTSSPLQLDYDIVICGGTLGIFFALALLLRNPKFRICVVESAPAIRGRDQEWNISLSELYELIKLGVLTESDLDDIITTEFPACRSGFKVRFFGNSTAL